MKAKANLNSRFLGLACTAFWLGHNRLDWRLGVRTSGFPAQPANTLCRNLLRYRPVSREGQSDGNALLYSIYLGTRSPDSTAAIGLDRVGNAYVTGKTSSDRFVMKDALQTMKPSGPFDNAASQILFSTYLGSEPSFGSAIAVDRAGSAYVVGTTEQLAIVPSARLPEGVHGGYDAFVMKIASPPRITGISASGKNLIVTGKGFDKGTIMLVDGGATHSKR